MAKEKKFVLLAILCLCLVLIFRKKSLSITHLPWASSLVEMIDLDTSDSENFHQVEAVIAALASVAAAPPPGGVSHHCQPPQLPDIKSISCQSSPGLSSMYECA